jgi:hypothetical protein
MNGPTPDPFGSNVPANSSAGASLVDGHPDSLCATITSPPAPVPPPPAGTDQLLLRKALARWENEGGRPPGAQRPPD